jgi:hypothetical protein
VAGVHSRFGGSSADRWLSCPGSTALIATVPPRPDSAYAAEGTAAHELARLCLVKDQHPTLYLGETLEGFVVTQEMCDAVVVYLNAVDTEKARTKTAELYVEQGFVLQIDSAADDEVFGTNDAMVYHPSEGRLVVFDYKHGVGVSVSAEDNAQLKFYAAGAVFSKPEWKLSELILCIVQPRARSLALLPDDADPELKRGIQKWPMDVLDLMEFQGDVNEAIALANFYETDFTADPIVLKGPVPNTPLDLRPGAVAYVGGKPKFVTGSHCKWCDAAPVCPAKEAEVLRAAQLDFADMTEISTDVLPEPKTFDTARLGQILQAGKILNDWLNQIQEYVEGLVLSGTPVEGWKAVEKIGRAKWVAADEDVAGYVDMMFGIDQDSIRPRKLVTIGEFEKLLKAAGATKAQIDDAKLLYTIKESSGLTIAPASDRRPAVDAVAAAFGSVTIDTP